MEKSYSATSKYLRMSPSKIRPVADLIRGESYEKAIAILNSMPNKGAALIKKVLVSAGANARFQNNKLGDDMLYVKELKVDDGPRLKRVWPRSHGRRDILLKRMSHITVTVQERVAK